jgi:PAS domain S-box
MKAGATDYLLKSNLARIGPAIEAALARVQSRSEKARAEAALRRSEANLRAIFNTSRQAFVLVDRDGAIQALNPTAEEWSERITGRRLREGDRIHSFIPDAGDAFHLALAGEARSAERCLRDRDGPERWYETTHAPVVDEGGAVIGVCLNARDVSERMQAEQALRESEARYRDLFDNASDLVCTTTLDGAFLYVNPAGTRPWARPTRASPPAASSTSCTPRAGSGTRSWWTAPRPGRHWGTWSWCSSPPPGSRLPSRGTSAVPRQTAARRRFAASIAT